MEKNFLTMTKDEAIKYCYQHEHDYIAEMESCGENGRRQFDCLIEILESGTIQPENLPDYGMDF